MLEVLGVLGVLGVLVVLVVLGVLRVQSKPSKCTSAPLQTLAPFPFGVGVVRRQYRHWQDRRCRRHYQHQHRHQHQHQHRHKQSSLTRGYGRCGTKGSGVVGVGADPLFRTTVRPVYVLEYVLKLQHSTITRYVAVQELS